MKKYEVYKNIRKGAMIWGLPISLFAMMMLSILASLLVIIFSFSLVVIIVAMLWNTTLYVVLTKTALKGISVNFNTVFPKIISNKKENLTHYVDY
ncbi:hypothetical protein [Flagellimonas sp. CMM7]|uniref:hypothetical protein n=1 Tax=Flagellimonas sp. CMM7 TaxID=2654676 RepID=UPI0013D87D64|nr:hypothetical protein [Flagellimonas sp. CMM7]UII80098.1 hypothetical protein LV704_00920 [Flagellimonas sp. CMM7]